MERKILILFAHPAFHRSHANLRMIQAVDDMPGVTLHDLCEEYPNFNINVAHEQEALLSHDVVVLQHPFYWCNAPALLKEWQDLVLEYGFAYGPGGDRLHGKLLLSAVTTGAGGPAYCREDSNYFNMHELLAPFHQIARFCGMRWVPPFVVHGTLQEGDEFFRDAAESYRAALEGLRDGTIDVDHLPADRLLNTAVTTEAAANAR